MCFWTFHNNSYLCIYPQVMAAPHLSHTMHVGVLLATIHVVFLKHIEVDVIKEVEDYCVQAVSCDGNTLRYNKSLSSTAKSIWCCLPCSCDDDCIYTRTCCLDKEFDFRRIYYTPNAETCVKVSINNQILTNNEHDNLSDRVMGYLMVSSCPPNYTDVEKEQCESPNQNDLLQKTPVYSGVNQLSYRNIFCAKCNNKTTDMIDWKISMICLSLNVTLNILAIPRQGVLERVLSGAECYVRWTPPSSSESKLCYDDSDILSRCPVSPWSDNIVTANKTIRELCENVYQPIVTESVVYKNIYCLICITNLPLTSYKASCYALHMGTKNTLSFLLGEDIFRLTEVQENVSKICNPGLTYVAVLVRYVSLSDR